jgi:hypothetical protein
LISSNLLFLPQHYLGIHGFPRRVFDYMITYFRFNWISSSAVFGSLLSIFCFLLSILGFHTGGSSLVDFSGINTSVMSVFYSISGFMVAFVCMTCLITYLLVTIEVLIVMIMGLLLAALSVINTSILLQLSLMSMPSGFN